MGPDGYLADRSVEDAAVTPRDRPAGSGRP
jgi:hypothetical protein